MTAELEAEAARKKNIAQLAEKNRDDIKAYLETYKTARGKSDAYEAILNKLENFGYGAATSSLAGTAQAKYRLALGELSDLVSTFRRSRLTGRRFNKPAAEDVVREALGESTGKPEARAMADAVAQVNERQRGEYNACWAAIIGALTPLSPAIPPQPCSGAARRLRQVVRIHQAEARS